jgi:hypothetical protein
LSALVTEINDVLAFLVPDRALRLEVVRSETHTYPYMGQAQEVINRQIPIDYDIFVGVMWMRIGTPTANSPSGTVEEFRRAVAHRQSFGRPIIMFYFCDEQVPFPRGDELDQLQKVMKFREELSSIGYTLSYPKHAEFRDHVRGGLLRAVADLLGGSIGSAPPPAQRTSPQSVAGEDREQMAGLASKYDEIRRTMPSGYARTQAMTQIPAARRLKAAAVRMLLGEYQSSQFGRIPSCRHRDPSPVSQPFGVVLARGTP